MEPTGAEIQTVLDQLALGFGALQGRADATDARLAVLQQRVDDVQALVIIVKEAAEFQSVRLDSVGNRLDAVGNRLDAVDKRLTARTDSLERRMERGFTRVDERFEALTAEMRGGFDEMRRGFDELRRERRRRPKREG